MHYKLSTKKGALGIGDIGPVALSIGIAIITISVIALILANMSSASTNTNFTYIMYKGLVALTSFADTHYASLCSGL